MSKKEYKKIIREKRDYTMLDFSEQIERKFLFGEVERENGLVSILTYASNTPQAITRMDQFERDKVNERCIIEDPCSDARSSGVFNSFSTYNTASIGAAVNPSFFKSFYQDSGASVIVTFPHFDGEHSKKDEEILGCAGIGVKAASMKDDKFLRGLPFGLARYIEGEIHTSNPVLLAWLKALKISKLAPTKTVFAGILDQNTLKLLIFGAVTKGGAETYLKLDPTKGKENYHFEREEIIETLQRSDISNSEVADQLVDILELNRRKRSILGTDEKGFKADDFKEKNTTQDPLIIHISPEMRNIKIRYPGIVDDPNTCFSIRVPLDGKKGKHILTEPIRNQADFPFMKAVQAFKSGGGAFFNTRTLLIEARSEEILREIIESLRHTEFFREWLKKNHEFRGRTAPGGSVIVSLLDEQGKVSRLSKLNYNDIYSGY